MQPDAAHIGDAVSLIALQIIAVTFADSDTACAKLDLLGSRLLDAVRQLEAGPVRDIVNATAEVLIMSEI